MAWASFGRSAALCATMAVGTTFPLLSRRPPVAMSQEKPMLAQDNKSSSALEILLNHMMFLDARLQEWKVESSNFLKSGDASCTADDAKVQVVRLGSLYSENKETGHQVPFMRVVGFFPGALPDEIFEFMTDLQVRPQWDRNYHMFRKWDNATEGAALEDLEEVRRPIDVVAKKTPVCQDDHCLLVPDITERVVDHGWFAHRVGHALLERFGIADRFFVYQRRSVCYAKRGADADAPKMYDVLYSGSSKAVSTANEKSELFAKWLHACENEQKATRVSVNYQHILIIPIADAASQLWADPLPLSFGGSMVDAKTTKIIYDVFMNSTQIHKDTKKLDGTLMIMTSANDVQIPRTVPMWAQRMLASFFSNHAQREMLNAIRTQRKKKMIL